MARHLLPLRGTKKPSVEIVPLTGGRGLDVSPFLVYFMTYSSLDSPFMAAQIVISNENNIMSGLNVDGDWAVVISGTAGNGKTISGKFHINSFKGVPQNNNKSEAVEMQCIAMEHIHDDSQRINVYDYWYNKQTISSLVKNVVAKDYLGIQQVKGNVSTTPAVNINIPKMHPTEAIAFLLERGVMSGTKSVFSFYQKFDDSGAMNFYLDELSTLAKKGPKWKFIKHEGSYGVSDAHLLDLDYINGGRQSKIMNFESGSVFNARDIVNMGYASRSVIRMDTIKKRYVSFDDESQHTAMNNKQMPKVVSIANQNKTPLFNRLMYDVIPYDPTYIEDPKLETCYLTSKPVAAGLLGKRITLLTYGCPDVNTGDVVQLALPEYNSSENRPIDKAYSMNYLVYAVQHSQDGNGDFMSKYELVSDGEGSPSGGPVPVEGSLEAAEGTV